MTAPADARTVEAPSSPLVHRGTARAVTATWWYTVVALVFFELAVVLVWAGTLLQARLDRGAVLALLVGGLVWILSTAPLLRAYRHGGGDSAALDWRSTLVPLVVAAAYGVTGWSLTGLWVLLVLPLAQSLQLLHWPRFVRARMVLAVTALLAGVLVVDVHTALSEPPLSAHGDPYVAGVFSVLLPLTTVLSLWWWDVLITLDRARVSEARLAATQERLAVATDVHDLQGHHLQVIALQLELAERLLPDDRDAALQQLRAARLSVDEARQGTRDLATRFRAVPLPDELANARDLLRAAGLTVEAVVDVDADSAPASVFGPVIRETTTNVLRHGGGRRARLALTRLDGRWRYEISNDVLVPSLSVTAASPDDAGAPPGRTRQGTGLEGTARRAGDAGGSMEVVAGEDDFTVIVTVPAGAGASAGVPR
ncbi:sensor histidine kinase [Frigoribacterium sp. ACAM 257]|uniref:sensor histidine kinase n=1 Tax=Frigoribacterium sp. ACAM 257 TaxID=2508998 RepID=UPI0011B950FA|nr:histidine kinase [Frigoribacterium sp. ACAM 257]TWX35551.1 sensor histidine kinase [Frigoribacterium sp. ACAM 257]